jgi:hypothetical protein
VVEAFVSFYERHPEGWASAKARRRLPLIRPLFRLHNCGAEEPGHPLHEDWMRTVVAWNPGDDPVTGEAGVAKRLADDYRRRRLADPDRPLDPGEILRRGERYPTSSVTPATPPPFAPHLPVGLILSFKWVQPREGERYRRLNAIVLEGDSPPRRVARRASVEAHLAQRLSLPPAEAVDGPRSLRRLPLAEILYELHDRGAENPRHPDHSRWLETLEAW